MSLRHATILSFILLATFLSGCNSSGGVKEGAGLEEKVITVSGRENTTIKFAYKKHANPIAHIVAFPGGKGLKGIKDGMFGIHFGNYDKWKSFTIKTRKTFHSNGFSVAVVETPSDKKNGGLGGFRESEEHKQDIAAIIAHMKKDADVPVWLLGHSRGTVAAASQTINLGKDVVQGVVLSASIAAGRPVDTYVPDMPLDRVYVPALVMSAENDLCDEWTPKEAAKIIGEKLVNSPNAKVHYFKGASHHPRPQVVCKTNSAHSYGSAEYKAADLISGFIKENI
ncbi:MAG: hypothetical protein ABW088_03155 [Sedimenticola sp.]